MAMVEQSGSGDVGHPDPVPLYSLKAGSGGVMVRAGSEPRLRRRLAELGFRNGSRIEVVQTCSGGARIVRIGQSRYALDKRTATDIYVA